ncbi:hypothetical protein CBOM_04856 [Ceraceosorus bombacis]|uniref:Uncharacterized protein n=1 Tax=Ceraceosorus bombacis TaxID=401625 RepID=A0A0P1BQW8_9BASI|nr:hypothetical protein CBOM_04856 [Ceraceosorus bombacis]
MFTVSVHMVLQPSVPVTTLSPALRDILDGPAPQTTDSGSYFYWFDSNPTFNASQDLEHRYKADAQVAEQPRLCLPGCGGQHFTFPLKNAWAGWHIVGHVGFRVQQGVKSASGNLGFMDGVPTTSNLADTFIVARKSQNFSKKDTDIIGWMPFLQLSEEGLANPIFTMWDCHFLGNGQALLLQHWDALTVRLRTMDDHAAIHYPGMMRIYAATTKKRTAALCCLQVSHAVMDLAQAVKHAHCNNPPAAAGFQPSDAEPKVLQPLWSVPAPLVQRMGKHLAKINRTADVPVHICFGKDGMISVRANFSAQKHRVSRSPFAPLQSIGNTLEQVWTDYIEAFQLSILHVVTSVLLDAKASGNEQLFIIYALLQLHAEKGVRSLACPLWVAAHEIAREPGNGKVTMDDHAAIHYPGVMRIYTTSKNCTAALCCPQVLHTMTDLAQAVKSAHCKVGGQSVIRSGWENGEGFATKLNEQKLAHVGTYPALISGIIAYMVAAKHPPVPASIYVRSLELPLANGKHSHPFYRF